MHRQTTEGTNNVGTAYLLWLGCLLQLHGLHRLYNGKIFTGLLWLFSFGLFGVGQLIDLVLIPHMVQDHNNKLNASQGLLPPGTIPVQPVLERVVDYPSHTGIQPPATDLTQSPNHLIVQLLQAASEKGGTLSVTQAVMATGVGFAEAEAALMSVVRAGYADIRNHPETGIVIYSFREL